MTAVSRPFRLRTPFSVTHGPELSSPSTSPTDIARTLRPSLSRRVATSSFPRAQSSMVLPMAQKTLLILSEPSTLLARETSVATTESGLTPGLECLRPSLFHTDAALLTRLSLSENTPPSLSHEREMQGKQPNSHVIMRDYHLIYYSLTNNRFYKTSISLSYYL